MISRAFSDRTSFIHRLDPRVRLLAALALALVLAVSHNRQVLAGGLVCGFVLLLASRLPWRLLWRRFLWLNVILGMLSVSLVCTGVDGWARGSVFALRANAIMLVGTALLSTIEAGRLGQALRRLGVPAALTQLIFLTVRYADVIHDEYGRLRQAMRARGFRVRLNGHSLRALGYLVGNLLVGSFDRARRVSEAMCCRGFRGEFPSLQRHRVRHGDCCFLATTLVLVLLLSWWEYR